MKGEDITDKLIRVEITADMIERANEHARKDKIIYGFHNTKGDISDKDRFLGSLGEEIVSVYFKTPLSGIEDYDIMLNRCRVEIKSQGINGSRIKDDYDVHTYKISQKCDKYVFVIIQNNYRCGWIVGQTERRKFNDNCRREPYKGNLQYLMYISELEEI